MHYTLTDYEVSGPTEDRERAAIVTYAYPPDDEPHIDGHADLTVFLRHGDLDPETTIRKGRVEPGEPGKYGTWNWIPRA